MKIKRNIALSDSGFVFNPSTGDSYSVNPIGLEIIKMLKNDKDEQEIKKHVLDNYLTDETSFEKDFYDFTQFIRNHKLIEDDDKA